MCTGTRLSPGDLEREIGAFVSRYNERRYQESLNNLSPADVWYGQGQAILEGRRKLKIETLNLGKQLHYQEKTA
ncbi:MAG: hypothetical protein KC563_01035 [Nitrospira sp.]|nr:hypothetical protein [Nitrospira sp.]MCA9474385.1 hypothetical protein [Nitrospira sp.]